MSEKLYLGKWISCLYRMGRIYFDQHFANYGLGSGHISYIMFLFHQDGVAQDTISKHLYLDKATTTRSITKLEELGYVERRVDPTDRRAYKVYLTDKGRLLAPEGRRLLDQWIDAITQDFTEEERQSVYKLMERMSNNSVAAREQHLTRGE